MHTKPLSFSTSTGASCRCLGFGFTFLTEKEISHLHSHINIKSPSQYSPFVSNLLIVKMDPGTIISILEILSSVVKSLVEAGQIIHDAPEGLFRVVRETEKLRVLIDGLLIFQRGLSKEEQGILDKQVSSEDCKDMLKELSDLTSDIKSGHKDGVSGGKIKLADRWWWLRKKDAVEGLVKRLEDEQSESRGI
jgi:hypothetical protein